MLLVLTCIVHEAAEVLAEQQQQRRQQVLVDSTKFVVQCTRTATVVNCV